MLKIEMEEKLKLYERILFDIGCWVNPQQYDLDITTPKKRLLFHIEGVRKELDERFYLHKKS